MAQSYGKIVSAQNIFVKFQARCWQPVNNYFQNYSVFFLHFTTKPIIFATISIHKKKTTYHKTLRLCIKLYFTHCWEEHCSSHHQ